MTNVNKWFLWPEPRLLRGGRHSIKLVAPDKIEKQLYIMFGHKASPVVVSSGRVGIVLALSALGVSRADPVGIFGYASHCVLEAVSRVGSPACSVPGTHYYTRIIYHQWGYQQKHKLDVPFVEDSVDSFCLPSVTFFSSGGLYEIWSLSKIVGCQGGGVVWCPNDDVAEIIRILRDSRNQHIHMRWFLRCLSEYFPYLLPYWYGVESMGGSPPSWACGSMLWGLERWELIEYKRRLRLDMMYDLAPSWLPSWDDRLPSVIPVTVTQNQLIALNTLGFSSGFRHFELIDEAGSVTYKQVFPLPVHHDVPLTVLEKARDIILSKT